MTQTILHKLVQDSHRLAKSSKPSYLAAIDRWISFAGADPAKWTRYRMQEFYDHLLAKEKLKPQSAARVVSSIRYAANRWAEMEARPELDFSIIEFAKNVAKKRRPALDENAARKLLASCSLTPHGLRDFTFFVVALETGMRLMSLAGMTSERTSLSGLEPLAGSTERMPWTAVPLKGLPGEHCVPLSDVAVEVLAVYARWLAKHKAKAGPFFRAMRYSPINKSWSISSTALSHRALYNTTVEHAEAAGIGHVHPHLFRHTFITWRMIASVPPEQIAAITLHKLEESRRLGTIYDYTDRLGTISQLARATTPAWLTEFVGEQLILFTRQGVA